MAVASPVEVAWEKALADLAQRTDEIIPDVEYLLGQMFQAAATVAVKNLTAAAAWDRKDANELYDVKALEKQINDLLAGAKDDLDVSMRSALGDVPPGDFDTGSIAHAIAGWHGDQVQQVLVDSWNLGLDVDSTAAALEEIGATSAGLVARTTMNGMSNASSLAGAAFAGVEIKTWLTAGDDRVRPSHEELDEQSAPLNGTFANGCRFPGDPAGPPEEVWNCRCTLTYSPPIGGAAISPVENELGLMNPGGATSRILPKWDEDFHPGAKRKPTEESLGLLKQESQAELARQLESDPRWDGTFNTNILNLVKSRLPNPGALADFPAMNERSVLDDLVRSWARSSSDNNIMSLRIQVAVSEEFGVPVGENIERLVKKLTHGAPIWDGVPASVHDSLRAFVRAQYEMTQAQFAAEGITEVKLYRGIVLDNDPHQFGLVDGGVNPTNGADALITSNPLTSWSVKLKEAAGFAEPDARGGHGYVFSAVVPVTRILSGPTTGFGCNPEFEFVLLGGEDLVSIHLPGDLTY